MTDSRLKARGKQDSADICRHRSILLVQPNRNGLIVKGKDPESRV